MQPKYLDDDLAVLPQIDPADATTLAQQGFKTIINNRPDNEEPGQPSIAEVQQAAEAAGLAYKSQPVVSGAITFNDVADFKALIDAAEKPVLAFCRSGTRSTMLWAMANAGKIPTAAIMASAAAAGYNLEGLRRQIEALAAAEADI